MVDASSRALSILVCTWNVGNKIPDSEELEHWLPAKGGSHDLIAIGTQENSFRQSTVRRSVVAEEEDASDHEDDEEDGQPEERSRKPTFGRARTGSGSSSIVRGQHSSARRRTIFGGSGSKQHAWDAMCAERLGSGWVVVAHVVLREMRLSVYCTRELVRSSVKHVATAYAATGLKGLYGNKGGLVARLTIGDTSLAFCSCHLAAHEGQAHFSQRNAMCRKVLLKTMGGAIGGMREKAWLFGRPGRPLDIAHAVDHLFWCILQPSNPRIACS